MENAQPEAQEQQPQQASMSPQEAFTNVIARQRDAALNRAAQLEVQLALALQENADLKQRLAPTQDATPVAANRAARRVK